jgi:hypothetical protein
MLRNKMRLRSTVESQFDPNAHSFLDIPLDLDKRDHNVPVVHADDKWQLSLFDHSSACHYMLKETKNLGNSPKQSLRPPAILARME